MTTSIPSPPGLPIVGHVLSFDLDLPLKTMNHFANLCGEIFELRFMRGRMLVISSVELVSDVSNDRRFTKSVTGPFAFIRLLAQDGLFTAKKSEPNWGIAHRILMPKFKQTAVRDLFPQMLDITSQLILKWERFGPRYPLHPTEDFTRLSLDVLSLCCMSYRLNSFYREDNHPFVQAMTDFLLECSKRPARPTFINSMMTATTAKFEQDICIMRDVAHAILDDRRQFPIESNDVLQTMLHDTDPKTGEKLSDESIINNLLTLMIAGHETTAGVLSFALFYLVKHPEKLSKAHDEIDEVLGGHQIQVEDINNFPYILAVLRETIRLAATIPWRQVYANEDTVIGGGKYFVPKGRMIVVHNERSQRDPKVWGDDADEFKPERLMDGKFEALPSGAWQPFGFGMRACIGRAFAIQEAILAMVMILQKFDFVMADPEYELAIRQTLTIKPTDFYCHAIPRDGGNGAARRSV